MRIEFAWASPNEQVLRILDMPEGSTVADVIEASGVGQQYPDIDFDALDAGIWGEIKDRETRVRDGDRVEVYRELLIDPREARRARAKD